MASFSASRASQHDTWYKACVVVAIFDLVMLLFTDNYGPLVALVVAIAAQQYHRWRGRHWRCQTLRWLRKIDAAFTTQ